MRFLGLHQATDRKHKYVAVLTDGKRTYRIYFGAYGYDDFTTYYKKDPKQAEERKRLYLIRHQHERWTDPLTAGFWSRYILWNKPTVQLSLSYVLDRFF